MELIKRTLFRAVVDRKGVTALEYCMIAAGASTVVAACYDVFFERAGNYLNTVTFTG